jgi:nucleoid-associated protein YgaU
VITDVEEGEVLRLPRSLGGNISRYQATLKVMEFINPDQIRLKRRKRARKRFPVFYVVRKGDTLLKIAHKVYGDKSKWKKIGEAQTPKIRDPRKQLKPGRKLRIPGMTAGLGNMPTGALGAKGSFE